MSTNTKNLNHSTWDCQYHVVFTPKYRKKTLYGTIQRVLKGCHRHWLANEYLLAKNTFRLRFPFRQTDKKAAITPGEGSGG